jgi:hypothetical protein
MTYTAPTMTRKHTVGKSYRVSVDRLGNAMLTANDGRTLYFQGDDLAELAELLGNRAVPPFEYLAQLDGQPLQGVMLDDYYPMMQPAPTERDQ